MGSGIVDARRPSLEGSSSRSLGRLRGRLTTLHTRGHGLRHTLRRRDLHRRTYRRLVGLTRSACRVGIQGGSSTGWSAPYREKALPFVYTTIYDSSIVASTWPSGIVVDVSARG